MDHLLVRVWTFAEDSHCNSDLMWDLSQSKIRKGNQQTRSFRNSVGPYLAFLLRHVYCRLIWIGNTICRFLHIEYDVSGSHIQAWSKVRGAVN